MIENMARASHLKACPVDIALNHLGKKWTMHIIRDLFFGKKKFSDFLKSNPSLSTKVLSQRLREMQEDGFIKKKVISKNPLEVNYALTKLGYDLQDILMNLTVFSLKHYKKEVYNKIPKDITPDIALMKKLMKHCK